LAGHQPSYASTLKNRKRSQGARKGGDKPEEDLRLRAGLEKIMGVKRGKGLGGRTIQRKPESLGKEYGGKKKRGKRPGKQQTGKKKKKK